MRDAGLYQTVSWGRPSPGQMGVWHWMWMDHVGTLCMKLATTLRNHRHNILTYCKRRITNGVAEGLKARS